MKLELVTHLAIYFVDNNRLHESRHFPESGMRERFNL